MAEHKMPAARFWPRHTVRVATRVLPGARRDRHRQEFLAAPHDLSRAGQLRHAAGVLRRRGALRVALHTPSQATAADPEVVVARRRRPLTCRLNLRHRWTTARTEDGTPYRRCQRCGTDETDIFAGTKSGREFDGVPPGIGSAVFGHGS